MLLMAIPKLDRCLRNATSRSFAQCRQGWATCTQQQALEWVPECDKDQAGYHKPGRFVLPKFWSKSAIRLPNACYHVPTSVLLLLEAGLENIENTLICTGCSPHPIAGIAHQHKHAQCASGKLRSLKLQKCMISAKSKQASLHKRPLHP